MKPFAALIVGALVIGAVIVEARSKEQGTAPAVDAGVRALSEQYSKAIVAGDWKTLAGLYTDDGLEMRPDMPALKGPAAIQQFYEKMLPQLFPGLTLNKLAIDHIDTREFGDAGYDVGTYTETLTAANGTPLNSTGKYVAIAKRVGGAWKIAYLSFSGDTPPTTTK